MELRIIGGIYKNRSIKMKKSEDREIRPTLVRARRIIFDTVINRAPENFSFLDCFAGSGIMGIEALSRGAQDVVFFDINPFAIKNINENLSKMDKIGGKYSVIKTSIFRPPEGKKMDVIFLDPPYEKCFIIPDVLEKLEKYQWIGKDSMIVIETHLKSPVTIDEKFVLFKESKVSNSIIKFFIYE